MSKSKLGSSVIGLILIGAVAGAMVCTEKIPAGYVGVQYSMSGGVQDEILTQGWHIVSPTKKVTTYSVATEQLYLSANEKEGGKDNTSFDVVTSDGRMNVDFEMSYSFDPDLVPELYTRYRGMSGEDIIDNIIIGKVKTLVNEVTSQYTVLQAHMEKKAEVNKAITDHLRESLSEFGVVVESANLTQTRVDAEIEAAITKRSAAAQELETEKQKKEKAQLEQETKRIEAETIAIENEKINQTLTKEMLMKMFIEKWNGELPTAVGSDTILNLINEQLEAAPAQ